MQPRIKVLPPALVEKIAAGEVVERPASVVKELVENSIDAGARRIFINVKGGGIKEIRVSDDGCGMSREEAILAFERHATSKIASEEDLKRITTLGFRGEALPSIAAVSKVEMITRRKEDIVGTKLIIEGGEIKKIEETGAPVGTSVLVKDLFYNTPARRKFLKGVRSEFSQISYVVEKYALLYPHIHFKLVNEGRTVMNAPPSDLRGRVMKLWGTDIAREMVEISGGRELRVQGLISKPYRTRRDRGRMIIFVNGRYVKSKLLEDAVLVGYGTLLFRDSYPYTVLKIEIPPEKIDVNVHPAKLYVKFENEEEVKKEISRIIWDTLTREESIPQIKEGAAEAKMQEKSDEVITEMVSKERMTHFDVEKAPQRYRIEDFLPKMRTLPMQVLGQVGDTYIILKSSEGLVIVDQHAAHERIRYERFLRDMRENKIQELLEPIVLELSFTEHERALELMEELKKYGFVIEDFGNSAIVVRGIPPLLTRRDAEEAIREIISLGPQLIEKKRDEIIKLISCKGAIKANQKLSIYEMEQLVNQLLRCENPYTCPHGRPTMIKLRLEDLEKMFKRKE